jgi:hypothetical protein
MKQMVQYKQDLQQYAANSVNITPTSNADTLTITAGNNISITACTTTKTIIINSTASGGGGGGSGALTYDTLHRQYQETQLVIDG